MLHSETIKDLIRCAQILKSSHEMNATSPGIRIFISVCQINKKGNSMCKYIFANYLSPLLEEKGGKLSMQLKSYSSNSCLPFTKIVWHFKKHRPVRGPLIIMSLIVDALSKYIYSKTCIKRPSHQTTWSLMTGGKLMQV